MGIIKILRKVYKNEENATNLTSDLKFYPRLRSCVSPFIHYPLRGGSHLPYLLEFLSSSTSLSSWNFIFGFCQFLRYNSFIKMTKTSIISLTLSSICVFTIFTRVVNTYSQALYVELYWPFSWNHLCRTKIKLFNFLACLFQQVSCFGFLIFGISISTENVYYK